jgi:hypothetical protein
MVQRYYAKNEINFSEEEIRRAKEFLGEQGFDVAQDNSTAYTKNGRAYKRNTNIAITFMPSIRSKGKTEMVMIEHAGSRNPSYEEEIIGGLVEIMGPEKTSTGVGVNWEEL